MASAAVMGHPGVRAAAVVDPMVLEAQRVQVQLNPDLLLADMVIVAAMEVIQ